MEQERYDAGLAITSRWSRKRASKQTSDFGIQMAVIYAKNLEIGYTLPIPGNQGSSVR